MKTAKIILIMFLTLIFSTSVFSIALGVSPSRLDYKQVLKGGFAQKTVLISTDTTDDLSINLEKNGSVSSWIQFGSLGEDIDTFVTSANNPFILQVRITPPSDIANGNYSGYVRAITQSLTNVETGKGSAVKAAFMILVNVEIVGNEIVNCIAGGFDISSFEIGEDLPLVYTIENTGNVRIDPNIDLELRDNRDRNLLDLNTNGESLLPTLKTTYVDELNNDLEIGQYFATIKVPLCNARKDITFNVVEPGGISDTGDLVSITAPTWAKTEEILPITALFKNTGGRNVRAKFIGDIKDAAGNLVKVIDTDFLTVEDGGTQRFQTFFKPSYPGQYFINGKISFNNKITFEKTTIINVNEGATGSGNNYGFVFLIFIVIVAIILMIMIKQKKINLKRRKHKHKIKFKF